MIPFSGMNLSVLGGRPPLGGPSAPPGIPGMNPGLMMGGGASLGMPAHGTMQWPASPGMMPGGGVPGGQAGIGGTLWGGQPLMSGPYSFGTGHLNLGLLGGYGGGGSPMQPLGPYPMGGPGMGNPNLMMGGQGQFGPMQAQQPMQTQQPSSMMRFSRLGGY